ncbi:MAG: hypothetical protein KBC69_02005 [Candidatus Magasanikbacteria bacterium]|nr:hypothetical protein [Candidatus Magasanikbacteria bacterium]
MPGLKNMITGASKLPSKPGLGNFLNRPKPGLTSITHQNKPTASFHQFGDAVSHTQNNERSGKIFGSINRAIKNKLDSGLNAPSGKNNTPPNTNFRPKI